MAMSASESRERASKAYRSIMDKAQAKYERLAQAEHDRHEKRLNALRVELRTAEDAANAASAAEEARWYDSLTEAERDEHFGRHTA